MKAAQMTAEEKIRVEIICIISEIYLKKEKSSGISVGMLILQVCPI